MSDMFRLVLAALIALHAPLLNSTGAACAATVEVILTEFERSASTKVAFGERLQIILPWQPGTGYQWRLVATDPEGNAVLEDTQFRQTPTEVLGGTEQQVFVFSFSKLGSVRLEFGSVRFHQQDSSERVVVNVEVI